jgi:hypothetical protein
MTQIQPKFIIECDELLETKMLLEDIRDCHETDHANYLLEIVNRVLSRTVHQQQVSGQPVPGYVREEVMRFAIAMEAILRENDHKGGWLQPRCGTKYLFDGLTTETKELYHEIEIDHKIPALKESCDVGNFDMMLFDTIWDDSDEEKHRAFEKAHNIPFNLDTFRSRPVHQQQEQAVRDQVLDAFDELLFDIEQIHQEETNGEDDELWDKVFHAVELRKAELRQSGDGK